MGNFNVMSMVLQMERINFFEQYGPPNSLLALPKRCGPLQNILLDPCLVRVVELLRARPKAERVFAEYENFLKLSDRPTDRPTVTLFSVLYLLNQATD